MSTEEAGSVQRHPIEEFLNRELADIMAGEVSHVFAFTGNYGDVVLCRANNNGSEPGDGQNQVIKVTDLIEQAMLRSGRRVVYVSVTGGLYAHNPPDEMGEESRRLLGGNFLGEYGVTIVPNGISPEAQKLSPYSDLMWNVRRMMNRETGTVLVVRFAGDMAADRNLGHVVSLFREVIAEIAVSDHVKANRNYLILLGDGAMMGSQILSGVQNVKHVDFPYPTMSQIDEYINYRADQLGGKLVLSETEGGREAIVAAAFGGSLNTVERTIAEAAVSGKEVTPEDFRSQKRIEISRRSGGVLTVENPGEIGIDDLYGHLEIREWLKVRIAAIKRYLALVASGQTPPKNFPTGLMLLGAPGTGKTYLAQAIAKELGTDMLAISTLMGEGIVGDPERNGANLLYLLRQAIPYTVIFVDEADDLFSARGRGQNDGGARNSQTNAMNKVMSDREVNSRVIFIAASNLPDNIDKSFTERRQRFQNLLPMLSFGPVARLDFIKRELGKHKIQISPQVEKDLSAATRNYNADGLRSLVDQIASEPGQGNVNERIVKIARNIPSGFSDHAMEQSLKAIEYTTNVDLLPDDAPEALSDLIKAVKEHPEEKGELVRAGLNKFRR